MYDQPGGLSLLRLLVPSVQFPYNVPPLTSRLTSHILSQEEPHPRVPLAHTVPLANAQSWEPFLLGGLLLLVGLFPAVWCVRGSGLWKLEVIPRVDFHSLVVSTLARQPYAPPLSSNIVAKAVLVQLVLCDLCGLF